MDKVNKSEIRIFFSRKYWKIVHSFRNRFTNISPMDIEDIVSDVMADLFSKGDITGQIENLGGYVYRAVQNRLIDYLRKRKKTGSLEKLLEENPSQLVSLQDLDLIEIRNRLSNALGKLKQTERAVWFATEIENQSFRELSRQWGVPIGTLLARKHRANASLQKHLYDLIAE